MSPSPDLSRCEQSEVTCAYALQILPASEVAAPEAHIASCPDCQRELESLRPVVDRLVAWPTDVLRPTASLQGRLRRGSGPEFIEGNLSLPEMCGLFTTRTDGRNTPQSSYPYEPS